MSEPVVSITGLNLSFDADFHRSNTWRDLFTGSHRGVVENKALIRVARDLNLEVRQGERVGLLGVNGAGKTSLCRCVAGIYYPDSGDVVVRGRVRAIFDTSLGVLPELTGRENAELLAELLYPRRPNRDKLVQEALEFSGLGDFLDVPFRTYSNGMQARLCLSIVTAAPSDLLILDEVFDGADAFFREKAAQRVLSMMSQSGAVLFVSHSPDQIRRACNRTVVLSEGKIVFDGGVEEGLAFYSSQVPASKTLSL
jgi:ABC-type polysaccharide/polyol phosphate transport system ATPase subunit